MTMNERSTTRGLNLISQQTDIDKIYSYAKDPYETKYEFLINKQALMCFNDLKLLFIYLFIYLFISLFIYLFILYKHYIFFQKNLQSPGTIFLVCLGINQQKSAQKSNRYGNINRINYC